MNKGNKIEANFGLICIQKIRGKFGSFISCIIESLWYIYVQGSINADGRICYLALIKIRGIIYYLPIVFGNFISVVGWYNPILSKPKLNQNLSSTEFEVRLHSYSDIHPPPTQELTMLWLLLTGQAEQGRDRLYNCTLTHRSVQVCTAYLSV